MKTGPENRMQAVFTANCVGCGFSSSIVGVINSLRNKKIIIVIVINLRRKDHSVSILQSKVIVTASILMRVKFWKVFKENVLCEC